MRDLGRARTLRRHALDFMYSEGYAVRMRCIDRAERRRADREAIDEGLSEMREISST